MFRQVVHQLRVVNRVQPVPNSFRLQITQSAPDRFRPNTLTGVSCQPQSLAGRSRVEIGEPVCRPALFIASNTNPDNVTIPKLSCFLKYLRSGFHSKMAGSVEYPVKG